MRYSATYPTIHTLQDILPWIESRDEIKVIDKGEYIAVNYVVTHPETFFDPDRHTQAVLRECRGLIFDSSTGALIARRFHKFFNLNENEEMQEHNVNFVTNHTITNKLDGSMVTPMFLQSGMRWGTKAGITDVSLMAEKFAATNKKYKLFAEVIEVMGCTPIFEYCGPDNRIVIEYANESLTLLAIRNKKSGDYYSRTQLVSLAKLYDINVAAEMSDRQIADTYFEVDEEGIVIQFEGTGQMIKVKSLWYVDRHKTVELIRDEKTLVKAILENRIDDVIAVASEQDKEFIENVESELYSGMQRVCTYVYNARITCIDVEWDRKTFALRTEMHPMLKNLVFKIWDSNDIIADVDKYVIELIKKNCGRNVYFDRIKELFDQV